MKKELLEKIAQEILRVETLETRSADDLDFHETSVWSLKKALELAFEAGAKAQDGSKLTLINTSGDNWILAKDFRDEE